MCRSAAKLDVLNLGVLCWVACWHACISGPILRALLNVLDSDLATSMGFAVVILLDYVSEMTGIPSYQVRITVLVVTSKVGCQRKSFWLRIWTELPGSVPGTSLGITIAITNFSPLYRQNSGRLLVWKRCETKFVLCLLCIYIFFQLTFLSTQILSLPLAVFFRTFLSPSQTSVATRHAVGAVFGLALLCMCFGW